MASDDLNSGSLSDRELQILERVASGLTNQDIAEQLDISKRTVDNHISNILNKTGTDNRVALVRWALQWGKVCLDEVNCCVLPPAGTAPKAVAAESGLEDAKKTVEVVEDNPVGESLAEDTPVKERATTNQTSTPDVLAGVSTHHSQAEKRENTLNSKEVVSK